MNKPRKQRSLRSYLSRTYKLGVLRRSLGLMGKRKSVYLGFLGMCLASSVVGVVIGPIMNKRVINAIEFADGSLFDRALVLMILSTLLFWLVLPIATYAAAWASKQAMFRVRSRLSAHLLKLPYRYYDKHSKGEALSHLSNDLDCLEYIYDGLFYKTLENFCIGFTGLIMLFVIDWRLAIVASILGVGSTWVAGRYSAPLGRIGERLQQHAEQTTTVFLDILKGIRTVKLYNLGALMGQKLAKTTLHETECQLALSDRQAQMNVFVGIINGLSTFGILIIGAFMVQEGLTDWGSVVVVSTLQFATGDLFSLFPMSLAGMQSSLAGAERLLKLLDEPEEAPQDDKYAFSSEASQRAALEMSNVSFGYRSGELVLKHISFTLNKGEITALVGDSGGGKSTLVKLLLRLYSPDEGKITIARKASEVDAAAWRACIAYVPQNPRLFRGTIAENIAIGKENAAPHEIEAAARAAEIHDYIQSLPEKYQTQLSEDGGNLSGGQRQRIAIARALVKKADILLLDELTSALDGESEAKIMQTIRRLSVGHTVLVIAHREAVLDYADKVFKLEAGAIVPV